MYLLGTKSISIKIIDRIQRIFKVRNWILSFFMKIIESIRIEYGLSKGNFDTLIYISRFVRNLFDRI